MRYRSLDSMRGLAAVVVLLHHCLLALPWGGENRQQLLSEGLSAPLAWLYLTPLRLAVIGPAAVLLFFVLSGFVLTLSISGRGRPTYWSFAVARIARIWLPFAAAILASAAIGYLLKDRAVAGASVWFHAAWSNPINAANLMRHLLMTGTSIDLNSPMWSLIHELRISLIFPLLVLVVARLQLLSLALAALLTILSVFVADRVYLHAIIMSWISTNTYIYFFIVGILLAKNTDLIASILMSLSRTMLGLLWALALAGIAIAPADTYSVTSLSNAFLLLLNGVAAGLLIALCIIQSRASKFLCRAWPRYLGRISYSLYLTHVITIVSLGHIINDRLPLEVTMLLAMPLSLFVADLFYRAVEAPSHHLGKWAASSIVMRRAPTLTI